MNDRITITRVEHEYFQACQKECDVRRSFQGHPDFPDFQKLMRAMGVTDKARQAWNEHEEQELDI